MYIANCDIESKNLKNRLFFFFFSFLEAAGVLVLLLPLEMGVAGYSGRLPPPSSPQFFLFFLLYDTALAFPFIESAIVKHY